MFNIKFRRLLPISVSYVSHKTDVSSVNKTIILIRHAESNFNKASIDYL